MPVGRLLFNMAGPMIVSIDTKGQNLFEKNKKVFNARKQPIVDEINKHVDYFD